MEAREKVAFGTTLSGAVMCISACTNEHSLEHAMSAYHQELPHGAGLIMIAELKNLSESVIFPKGQKIKNDYFIGTAWLKMLVPFHSKIGCPIGNVTFEPGCCNNWHKHPGGQILLVTGGKGWYQEDGKKARELHEGDVVEILPNVKHWHGAADSWFAHIAVEAGASTGPAECLEPVTDDEYNHLV